MITFHLVLIISVTISESSFDIQLSILTLSVRSIIKSDFHLYTDIFHPIYYIADLTF